MSSGHFFPTRTKNTRKHRPLETRVGLVDELLLEAGVALFLKKGDMSVFFWGDLGGGGHVLNVKIKVFC